MSDHYVVHPNLIRRKKHQKKIPVEGHSRKHLTSTLQNSQVHQKQESLGNCPSQKEP